MDSWEIGTFDDSSGHATIRNSPAQSRCPTRKTSVLMIDDLMIDDTAPRSNHPVKSLMAVSTADSPIEHSNKVLQYKVWREKGTAASARGALLASRGGSSIATALAVAAQGDALIHGPRLVAQSVGSEWRIHRLQDLRSQSNQPKGDLTE